MRLPVIREINAYIAENDEKKVLDTVDTLEHISQARGIKPEEADVIGELISNMLGSIEVSKMIKEGSSEKDALNNFMKRVMGSIDS